MPRLTKPELAIVAGVIIVLISLVVPSAWGFYISHRKALARRDIRELVRAGERYVAEYGVWPTTHTHTYGDTRFGQQIPNREIMNALRAVDGPGNEKNAANPNRIVFLDVPLAQGGGRGIGPMGNFRDPWGTPYQVVLDTDLNGRCDVENSVYGMGIAGGMIVWSCGPDRRSDTPDDILSWQRPRSIPTLERVVPLPWE